VPFTSFVIRGKRGEGAAYVLRDPKRQYSEYVVRPSTVPTCGMIDPVNDVLKE
jgi:hypothetical protein